MRIASPSSIKAAASSAVMNSIGVISSKKSCSSCLQVVLDIRLNDCLDARITRQAQAAGSCVVPRGRPTSDNAFDQFVAFETNARSRSLSRYPANRVDDFPNGNGDARQVDAAVLAQRRAVDVVETDEAVDGTPRGKQPQAQVFGDRTHGLLAAQWLANDSARKRRSRLIRAPRTHADGRQPCNTAIDESLSRVVHQQEFADRLLNA